MPTAGQRNIGREDSYIIDRVKNQNGAAEGSILPPRQVGATRVPIVENFRVLTRTGFLGGTEFVLAFSTPPNPSLNISTYNILYRKANSSSFSSCGASTVSPVTVRIPIADPVKIVFICQTILSNGFNSEYDSSPSCTSETFLTQITPGSIAGLDLVYGGAAMTPAGRVPFTAAGAGYLTTDAQLQFDPATKRFGVGAGALVAGITTDKSVAFGVDPTTHAANFSIGDYWLTPVNTSGGAVTATLPAATGLRGKWIVLKKTTGDVNNLIIAAAGADTIDGAATQTITPAYGLLAVVCLSNTTWGII